MLPMTFAVQTSLSQWIAELPPEWDWLNRTFLGNELWRWGALLAALLVAAIAGCLLKSVLLALSRRSERRGRRPLSVMFRELAGPTALATVLVGLHLGLRWLDVSRGARSIEATLMSVLATILVGYAGFGLVRVIDEWLRAASGRTASKLDDMLVPLVRGSLHGAIVVLVVAQVAFYVSGTQLTSIVAGLGVGALAVGLAAQDTIKNFFGSMMIFGDRPFEMGDQIIVDSHEGSVEAVGFRSTRFRTADGHLVTIPNGELANKTIVNVSRRRNLQRKFTIALPANLRVEKLEQALESLRQAVDQHQGMSADMPPRVFLSRSMPRRRPCKFNTGIIRPTCGAFRLSMSGSTWKCCAGWRRSRFRLRARSQSFGCRAMQRRRPRRHSRQNDRHGALRDVAST